MEVNSDPVGVGSGAEDEIGLELALAAVIHKVHARIHSAIAHLGIGRHIGAPLCGIVADEIVGLAGLLVYTRSLGMGVRANQRHAERGRCSVLAFRHRVQVSSLRVG